MWKAYTYYRLSFIKSYVIMFSVFTNAGSCVSNENSERGIQKQKKNAKKNRKVNWNTFVLWTKIHVFTCD